MESIEVSMKSRKRKVRGVRSIIPNACYKLCLKCRYVCWHSWGIRWIERPSGRDYHNVWICSHCKRG